MTEEKGKAPEETPIVSIDTTWVRPDLPNILEIASIIIQTRRLNNRYKVATLVARFPKVNDLCGKIKSTLKRNFTKNGQVITYNDVSEAINLFDHTLDQ